MLKSLELLGFKSFAEKTRFDFSPGITAIVGPNGSGKSNIVDAVRWILGEQSAKNLRGSEMADVIFHGSSTRRSIGMAEVTLTFDNTRRVLSFDGDEVQISRRIYRDGTSEYLINQHISRLKDIRELFLGSGAGTSISCIIEQGRVDALLQASTQDRRIILEEVAGISKFKARKIESLRKLERTEQNLEQLRMLDTEVQNQFKKVSLEAGKAKRYLEFSNRLSFLRIGIGLRNYRRLTSEIVDEQNQLESIRQGLNNHQSEAAHWENQLADFDTSLQKEETELERCYRDLSIFRQQITTIENGMQHDFTNLNQLEEESCKSRNRVLELSFHLNLLQKSVEQSQTELSEEEAQKQIRQDRLTAIQEESRQLEVELQKIQHQIEEDRNRQIDLIRQLSIYQSQEENLKQQYDRMQRDFDQRRRRYEQREAERDSISRVLDQLMLTDNDLQSRLDQVKESLEEKQRDRESLKRLSDHLNQEFNQLKVQRSDLRGRIEMLENWEKSFEGISMGVRSFVEWLHTQKELLDQVPSTITNTRLQHEQSKDLALMIENIKGLVVDLLRVPSSIAPLVDIALGEQAQFFVVLDSLLIEKMLTEYPQLFSGRIGFIPYQDLPALEQGDVTNSADRWVTCDDPSLAGLPNQLLGNVQLVHDLKTARQLATLPECQGNRFVTEQGELLDSNGTFTLGLPQNHHGIVSRKSELRDLHLQAESIDRESANIERRIIDLEDRIERMISPIHGLEEEYRMLTSRVGDVQLEMTQHQQNREHLDAEIKLSQQESLMLAEEISAIHLQWEKMNTGASDTEQLVTEISHRLLDVERNIRLHEHNRHRLQQEQTSASVALAQSVERVHSLTQRHHQIQSDLHRGNEESTRIHRHRSILEQRYYSLQLSLLKHSGELADIYFQKESLEARIFQQLTHRDQIRESRRLLQDQLQKSNADSRKQYEVLHQRELSLRDRLNSRTTLMDRIQSDYQIDLKVLSEKLELQALASSTVPEVNTEQPVASSEKTETMIDSTLPKEAVEILRNYESLFGEDLDLVPLEKEIEDLKKKVASLGTNVNLESIRELEEVEARAREFATQLKDLTESRQTLLDIIEKINTDSRKLFSETFETTRNHFQELFRKLFGGGLADIILENPDDVLESGIDIIARPPGKELRTISLLSGGEKTLTAVALLLAIFRSKPSPFCLLDEVDAALDEANTTRLANALNEFVSMSQFILITHKKRMMASADILYGITMQESGVSTPVSVRLEDWPDESKKQAA